MVSGHCGATAGDGRPCRHPRGTSGRCAAGHPTTATARTATAAGPAAAVATADPFASTAVIDLDATAHWRDAGHVDNPAYDRAAAADITAVFDVITDLGYDVDETWIGIHPHPAWASNQQDIDPARVDAIAAAPPVGDDAVIELVSRYGDVYIYDGNHRTAAAIKAGRTIDAVVMNADELEVYDDHDEDEEAEGDDEDWYGLG